MKNISFRVEIYKHGIHTMDSGADMTYIFEMKRKTFKDTFSTLGDSSKVFGVYKIIFTIYPDVSSGQEEGDQVSEEERVGHLGPEQRHLGSGAVITQNI